MFSLVIVASYHIQYFTFDASPDTLVVEGDPKLKTYLDMTEIFGGDEFLVVTYTRKDQGSLFTDESLDHISEIQNELTSIEGVESVLSILDAPLIKNLPGDIEEMSQNYKTLRSSDVDRDLAREELQNSPLFADYLLSSDGLSTIIRLDLTQAFELEDIRKRRDKLRTTSTESEDPTELLDVAEQEYIVARKSYVDHREEVIANIRLIRDRHATSANLFISGVPMIAADMIRYVRSDLAIFGSLVFICTAILLYYFFRRGRWVLLPIVISAITILFTTGFLGYLQKPVTVVSSNFISLLAIICISFSIHLIVRYRELLSTKPDLNHMDLVLQTMQSKFIPCLYTALTTLLAFGSMLGSNIVPVEDFGWMMCLGIILAFIVTYTVFPSALLIMGEASPSATLNSRVALTMFLSKHARHNSRSVLAISIVLALVSAYGLKLISFDNRFIDYFDSDTDVHEGLKYINDHLGGTVPFDIYIQFEAFDSLDEEDDFFTGSDTYPDRYWYTLDRLNTIARLHEFVQQQKNVGKVISLATLEKISRDFNEGKKLTTLEIAYVIGELPTSLREQFLHPYARPADGLVRINASLSETGARFSRQQMIEDIEKYATNELGLAQDDFVVTGMMVLFNDMLRQLADSQLRTLIYVVLATFFMFSLLLRSMLLAILALIPNLIAASSVLAFMGYLSIPMDMMTITIAAISIGIGVDDAIHYLHRFKEEVSVDHDVNAAIKRAHLTIGRAMYFTSMTIIIGFSILTFSNFLPTVYFGILTALAMLIALLANLTILPSLLIVTYEQLGISMLFLRSSKSSKA